MLSTLVLACLLLVLWALYLYWGTGPKKLPPGPTGLPLVGYLPFLTAKPHVKLLELKKKYGPVYRVTLGSCTVIVLSSFQVMKEAFNSYAFFGREPESIIEFSKTTKECGAFANLPWKEQRKFTLQALRDLGFGKSIMEDHISEEIREQLELLSREKGAPISASQMTEHSVSNVIGALLFGKRRSFEDPARSQLSSILERGSKAATSVSWITFFPGLKKLFPLLPFNRLKELKNAAGDLRNFVRKEIEERQMLMNAYKPKCFLDAYLQEIKENQKVGGNTRPAFNVDVLEDLAILFFAAGTETLSNTLDWLLLVTAAFPTVQKKVSDEIEKVIGFQRFPNRMDQQNMPYTEAVIYEILRWRASPPLMIPRYTLEDSTLNSYFIPKGTVVFSVTWAVHHDRDLWGDDVGTFRPERFLSEDGKRSVKPEHFIPFSLGKRACPGMSLAYMEIFLYFVAIVQKFHLKLPAERTADLDGEFRMTLVPKPHQLCFEIRQ